MSLLYLAIFHLALGGEGVTRGGLPLVEFVAPGLVIYALCERAFDTTSISLLFDKLEGMISDVLMAPLSALERTIAYAAAASSTGFVVAAVILAAQSLFVPWRLADPAARSEEQTSELQSLMRISYAVFCLTKKVKLKH